MSTALGAEAFTMGEHIGFARGRYQPDTPSGRQMLAHEVGHVVDNRRRAADGQPPVIGRWAQAGNCWSPSLSSTQIGQQAHVAVQNEMLGMLAPYLQVEVTLPGGGGGGLDPADVPGRADLVASQPAGTVPGCPGQTARPSPLLSPPHPVPDAAAIGEIKPASLLLEGRHPDVLAQLDSYRSAHDNYYRRTLGVVHSPAARLMAPVPPALITGTPFVGLWPTQALHVIASPGVYYYFCRPMVEIAAALAWLADRMREFLQKLAEMLERFGVRVGELAHAAIAAVIDGLSALADWVAAHSKELLIALLVIIAIVLLILFWEVVAIYAAAAAAMAEVMSGLEAVLDVAALNLAASGAPSVLGTASSIFSASGPPQAPSDLASLAQATSAELRTSVSASGSTTSSMAASGKMRAVSLAAQSASIIHNLPDGGPLAALASILARA